MITDHHPRSRFRPSRLRAARQAALGLACICASVLVRAQALPPTAVVQAVTQSESVSVDGLVQAIRQSTLAAQVAGSVTAIDVQAGDAVRGGQVLLHLDDQGAQQAQQAAQALIHQADAELALARSDLQRRKALYEQQYLSQAAYQQAQARLNTAQALASARRAQAREAQAHSSHYTIVAPHDGLISRVDAHLGDMVMPGQPVATLFDPGALRIQALVPQGDIDRLGPSAHIQWPAGYTHLPDTLPIQVLPARDAATLSGTIRIPLPAGVAGPAPGTPVRIRLDLAGDETHTRLWIPSAAVVRRADLDGVYVMGTDGVARLRQVRLGTRADDRIEVLAGLSAGETVVLDPARLTAKESGQ